MTIFVSPWTTGTRGTKKCPTTQWWPATGADDEERRVAYVAVTRTRGDLLGRVDERAYERLADARAAFVSDFTGVTSGELVALADAGLLGAAAQRQVHGHGRRRRSGDASSS